MSLSCPLCSKENYTIINKHLQQYPDAAIVKCNYCLHIYTLLSKQPKSDKLYNDKVYRVVENRLTIFDKILNWEYKRVIKKISSFKSQKGSLLDFGCGKGKFGSLAKIQGWHVRCVETNAERAEYANKVYGLETNTSFYSSGKIFNTDFDVLTLFHVLEHLPYPGMLLSELIKSNMKKNALVVIEVPNIKSLQSQLTGIRWLHLDVPRHLNHFTPKRLEQLGRSLDLITLKTTFFSFHLGVLGMTDSLMKLFGYRQNIIYELKNKKNIRLLLGIILLLPFSLIIETCAAAIGRGGVVRKYFIWNSNG